MGSFVLPSPPQPCFKGTMSGHGRACLGIPLLPFCNTGCFGRRARHPLCHPYRMDLHHLHSLTWFFLPFRQTINISAIFTILYRHTSYSAAIPGGMVSAAAIEYVAMNLGASYTWTVNIASGRCPIRLTNTSHTSLRHEYYAQAH